MSYTGPGLGFPRPPMYELMSTVDPSLIVVNSLRVKAGGLSARRAAAVTALTQCLPCPIQLARVPHPCMCIDGVSRPSLQRANPITPAILCI
jgi:hypothetical protein